MSKGKKLEKMMNLGSRINKRIRENCYRLEATNFSDKSISAEIDKLDKASTRLHRLMKQLVK